MIVLRTRDRFGNKVELSRERWQHILKHKISGLTSIEECVKNPVEVRKSKHDEETFLYYSEGDGRYTCVVVQVESGFILTAYETETIKEGETVWKRKK